MRHSNINDQWTWRHSNKSYPLWSIKRKRLKKHRKWKEPRGAISVISRGLTCVTRELQGEEGEEGQEKIFKEIIAIFFILMKTINSEFQEAQWILSLIDPNKTTQKCIMITSDTKKSLTLAKEKRYII